MKCRCDFGTIPAVGLTLKKIHTFCQTCCNDDFCHAPAHGNALGVPQPRDDVRGRGNPQRERRQLHRSVLWNMHPDAEETANLPADGRQQRGDREAEERGQRQGARSDTERQHRLHSAEDSDTHRAGGQKAVKD